MSLSCFSQKDTIAQVDSIVCIKKSVAKKIAKDLVKLDEVTAINKVLENDIDIYKNIIENKDTIIALKTNQFNLCTQQYINSSLQYKIVNNQLNDSRKKLKWSKFKTTVSQVLLVAVTTYFALKK